MNVTPRICPLCLRPKYQKHMETCSGPAQRIAPPPVPDAGSECGCNAGGWHSRDCPVAYWPETAAPSGALQPADAILTARTDGVPPPEDGAAA